MTLKYNNVFDFYSYKSLFSLEHSNIIDWFEKFGLFSIFACYSRLESRVLKYITLNPGYF